jgi:DNA sulfur modification protein DndD
MKIELLGWKSEGLRSPDIEVNLEKSDGSVARVSLLQMPNGTGKTTTLNCLRAAMDGSAESWSEEKVKSYREIDGMRDQGLFVATLRVHDTQKIIVEMTFHFNEGVVTYKTTVGSKTEDNYSPPPDVRRYLDPRFSKLLFFDGEMANNLIDGKGTTSASQIIDTFYGLYHLSELKENARRSYEFHEKRSGAKGAAQLTKLIIRRDSLREKSQTLKKQAETNEARLAALRHEHARINVELEEHLLKSGQFQEEEIRVQDERDQASSRLERAFHEVDLIFPDPFAIWPPLAAEVHDLVESLDRLKLTAQSSRLFLEDLVQEPVCVCDRTMDSAARASIQKRANQTLEDAVNGYLKSLKRQIQPYAKKGPSVFGEAVDMIIAADDDLSKAGNALENIRIRAAATGDEEVGKKKDQLKKIQEEIDTLESSLETARRFTKTGDDERCGCIDYFEKRLKEAENELARLSGTRELKHRTDTLIQVIDAAYKQAHALLKDDVVRRANERLLQILRYNPVQIRDIGNSVQLEGRGGASVGQTLAVGYVFLAGLLYEGGNQFPLVVDSPVGSLDDEARKELGGLIPILVKQMVGFVIATERKWFVDPLADASDGDLLYLTHLRINEYTKEIIADLKGNKRFSSDNGILLEGRDAFMALGEGVDETT